MKMFRMPLWMLGSGAKMLSCHVLKQFAVLSSRRPHYRNNRPSRETKKLHRSEGLFSYIPLGDRIQQIIRYDCGCGTC